MTCFHFYYYYYYYFICGKKIHALLDTNLDHSITGMAQIMSTLVNGVNKPKLKLSERIITTNIVLKQEVEV